MPKVIHFRDKCIGCNSCVELAPKYWEMSDDDGKSNLKKAEFKRSCYVLKIDDIDLEQNKKAARDCPVNIIKIEE